MFIDNRLTSLKEGQTATVRELSATGTMRRRLQDIGLIQGTKVECIGVSPMGDPVAYLIRGAVIALRNEDAAGILVENASDIVTEKATPVFVKRAGILTE